MSDFLSVVSDKWVAAKIEAALVAFPGAFSAVLRGYVPPEVLPPYMVIVRHPESQVTRPMGRPIIAETFTYDIAGWSAGRDRSGIVSAMQAVNDALHMIQAEVYEGHSIHARAGGEIPSANAPIAGLPPSDRLGRRYSVFISA